MEKQATATQTTFKPFQGFIADAKVYYNEERGTITHLLPDNIRIIMPVNLYKAILNIPFEKREYAPRSEVGDRPVVYGLIARPVIYLSKDGQYLIHRVLGVKVSKHVNYYKAILANKEQEQTA